MDWKQIEEANKLIQTIELKGKQYAEVKERVIAFRRIFPEGQIIPEITFVDNYILCDCTILNNEGKILSKGHAREVANKNFSLEACETSAIGRALGFIGLGISTSIASAEEMQSVEDKVIFDEPTPQEIKNIANRFRELYTKEEQARILNGLQMLEVEEIGYDNLVKYVRFKEQENTK